MVILINIIFTWNLLVTNSYGENDVQCKEEKNSDLWQLVCIEATNSKSFSVVLNINCKINNSFQLDILKDLNATYLSVINLHECKISPEIFKAFQNISLGKVSSVSYGINKRLLNDTFKEICSIQILDLSKNDISQIEVNAFTCLNQLKYLDLTDNMLTTLPTSLFSHLSSLEVLFLAKNELSMLHSDIFTYLNLLEILDISENMFTNLPNRLLQNNTKLIELYISNNVFQNLPSDLIQNLIKLEELFMDACNITSIPTNFFSNLPALEYISMFNNRLGELSEFIFNELENLKVLDLSFNDIELFHNSPFKNNEKLESIKLFKNNLNKITRTYFKGLFSLIQLDISHNFITDMDKNAFSDMPNLSHLNISHNFIMSLEGQHPFGYSEQLSVIDINDNELTTFPEIKWEYYLSLEELWVQHNKIRVMNIPEGLLLTIEAKIHLEWNQIEYININVLKSYEAKILEQMTSPALAKFYFQGNPIMCDCNAYDLFKYLSETKSQVISNSEIICTYPLDLWGRILTNVSPDLLQCNITEQCPSPCRCFLRSSDKALIMDCNNLGLTTLPETAPRNLKILYIINNNLTSLESLNDTIWENVTEIYADDNFIKGLELKLWPKLKKLTLSGNRLSLLPESIKNQVSEFKQFTTKLSNNLWQCDCSIMPFKKWLTNHPSQVLDINSIRCLTSNQSNSELLIHISENELCPIASFIPYIVVILVISICVTALLIIYYKNKELILAYLVTHVNCLFRIIYNQREIDDKIYDAFLCYNSSDREIIFEILKEIEEKPPHYKLCIHDRDWIPGNYITENIIESVKSSRMTIMIISKMFLKSVWFDVEFNAAYYQMLEEKMDRILIVIKGELPTKDEMNKDLQYLLSTKTYLIWGEKWFWEKLRYALLKSNNSLINKRKISVKSKAKLKNNGPSISNYLCDDINLDEI